MTAGPSKAPKVFSGLALLVFIGVAVGFSYFSIVFLLSTHFDHFAADICTGSGPWCTTGLRCAAGCSLVSLVAIPVMWFAVMRRQWLSVRDEKDWGEFLLDLTTTAVPLFVLGLAMLLELPKLRTAFSPTSGSAEGAYDAVGAVAGIMILYALTLLGAFVFDKLAKAKKEITDANEEMVKTLTTASTWLGLQQRLAATRGLYVPAPAPFVEEMLKVWAGIHLPDKDADGAASAVVLTDPGKVAAVCMSTLLAVYAKEESTDLSGQLPWYRVPPSVRPPGIERGKDAAKGRVSFFATNVGFYATFLSNVVSQLDEIGRSSKLSPCVAVVTNVLPSHWWNWPIEKGQHGIYPPIVQYRKAQEVFVRQGGQIFRKVVVLDKQQALSPLLHSLDESWVEEELKRDHLLFWRNPDAPDVPLRVGLSGDTTFNEALLTDVLGCVSRADDLTEPQKRAVFSQVLEKTNGSRKRAVYWVFDSALRIDCKCLCATNEHPDGSCRQSVLSHYTATMHREGGSQKIGSTDIHHVPLAFFQKPLGAEPPGGLGGCPDIMFLGLNKQNQSVWDRDSDPQWGCALMASMAPATETMFLTVLRDTKDIKKFWEATRAAFLDKSPVDRF